MDNPVSKIVAFLIAVVLIIWVPVYQSFEKQDALAYHQAYQSVTTFVDNVRNKGYITPDMYNDFQDELELGSYLFNVDLVHEEKVYKPVYTDAADPTTFQGKFDVHYDNYYNAQIFDVLFPNTNAPIEHPSRIYKFQVGDYFKVHVSNKAVTNASTLRNFLTLGKTGTEDILEIPYGGSILNEDY